MVPSLKNVNKLPHGFLLSEEANAKIQNLIESIHMCTEKQADINKMYDKFIEMVLEEMQNKLPLYGAPGRNKHRNYKFRKTFWNGDLQLLFNEVVNIEQQMRKCKVRFRKRDLRYQVKIATSKFDRAYQKEECKFKQEQIIELENYCENDKNNFVKS